MLSQEEIFLRSRMLIGDKAFERIQTAKILVVGVGGVGGAALEALARSGFLYIDVVDGDVFSVSNINRQILSTTENLGKNKAVVAKERILKINPSAKVNSYEFFYCKENENLINIKNYSYIVDAIDSVEDKILLIKNAKKEKINIISSMGAGRKKDPTAIMVADIFKTYNCPLAKIMRKRLREEKIESLKTAFSTEKPNEQYFESFDENKKTVASSHFVPNAMGILVVSHIVRDITNEI